jgi:hypothetical protein
MANQTIETSKKEASGRQIQAAIRHYDEGRFECAITLAHAGENMNAKPGLLSFFDKLKEKMSGTDHNLIANWLKHQSGPDTATISELEVVAMIQRAISKFHARFDFVTESMKAFQDNQRQKLQAAKKA